MRWKAKAFTVEELKTVKGRRMVDLPRVAVDAVRAHRVTAMAGGRSGFPWVFCQDDGTPVSRFRGSKAFPRMVEADVLPSIRFHDLRHTSASLMLANGTHPKSVQERLEHSPIGITMDTYSHILPGLQREAADKFDSVLSGNGYSLAAKPGSEAVD